MGNTTPNGPVGMSQLVKRAAQLLMNTRLLPPTIFPTQIYPQQRTTSPTLTPERQRPNTFGKREPSVSVLHKFNIMSRAESNVIVQARSRRAKLLWRGRAVGARRLALLSRIREAKGRPCRKHDGERVCRIVKISQTGSKNPHQYKLTPIIFTTQIYPQQRTTSPTLTPERQRPNTFGKREPSVSVLHKFNIMSRAESNVIVQARSRRAKLLWRGRAVGARRLALLSRIREAKGRPCRKHDGERVCRIVKISQTGSKNPHQYKLTPIIFPTQTYPQQRDTSPTLTPERENHPFPSSTSSTLCPELKAA